MTAHGCIGRRTTAALPALHRRLLTAGAFALVFLALAGPIEAQRAGDGFLFRRPSGSLVLRGGFDQAMAGGDLFSFVTEQLTLKRGDFGAMALGADLALRLAPRLDLVLGASFAGLRKRSEFRHWVDQDSLPIEQTTTLERVPVTASLRLYVAPRGRSIGQLAWVPARFAPFVGAGAGAMWYRFRQQGDFVDFADNHVIRDDFKSSAWTFTAHAFAGVDVSLGPRFFLTGEGRYTWARAPLSRDFEGFDRLDLSGLSVTAGVGIRN